MVDINKTLDGTLEKAIAASSKLNKLPSFMQNYMLAGDFKFGKAKKIDMANASDEKAISYAAKIASTNESQRSAIFKMTDFGNDRDRVNELKNIIKSNLELTDSQEKVSAALVESQLKVNGFSDTLARQVLEEAKLIDSEGNYLIVAKADAQQSLETTLSHEAFSTTLEKTELSEQKLAASIISAVLGQQLQTTTTWAQKFAIDALAGGIAIAKTVALSFGLALLSWGATKVIDWVKNLKTHSEQLVEAMNSSHEAAETAKQDIDDIQSKIDELNKSVEAAGASQISDIVDPAERERLQVINDMLQAQLELKKQVAEDKAKKTNADTSAVVNDKTEKSIYDFEEKHDWTGDYTEGKDITKTESLQEHTQALNEAVEKRRELETEMANLETAGKKESQEYKDKRAELDSTNEKIDTETNKVNELSEAVSEQMDGYETDKGDFDQYKDEYIAGTNAMTAATKALANANDDVGIDTTNLDIFSEKIKKIKNDLDNGDSQQGDWKDLNGLDTFQGMTGEAVINIDKDTAHQTEAESTALEKLHKVANDNSISFESLISVFETFGLLQVSNAESADNYAEQLEKTMGVIDNIQSAYKDCSTAVEEYNKYGYLSADSLQSLLQMDDQYLNTLELVNGKLQLNQSAYADLLTAQYAEAQMEAVSQAVSELYTIAKGDSAEKTETFTEAIGDEKDKLVAIAPALQDVTTGTGELAAALAAANSAAAGDDTGEIQSKIDGVMNALNTRLTLIHDNMQAAMNGASGLKNQLNGFSDSSNKAATSSNTLIDAWSTLTSAMKEFNEQGYITFQTLKSLTDLEDKYSSMLVKNDTTGQLEIRTQAFYDLMTAELKAAQAQGDGSSAAQYNKILEWTNRNINKQTMSYYDLVAAIEGYSAALDAAKEKTDGFKSAWESGKTVKEKIEESRTGALDYEGTEAQSSAIQQLMGLDPNLVEKAFNKETGKIDLSGDALKEAVVNSLKEQATAARTEGGAAAEAIARSYEISASNIENDVISVQDYFEGLGSMIDEVNTKIDDIQSAWSDIDDVMDEYNAYGGLSVDSLQKLLTMSPEYLACLEMNGDQLVFNADAMKQLLIAQLQSKAETLNQKDETKEQAKIVYAMIDSIEKNGIDAVKGMGTEAEKLKNIFSDIKSLFEDLVSVYEKANSNKSNDLKIWGEAMTEEIDKRIEALQEQNDEQERAIELAKLQAELEKAQTQKTVRVYTSNGYEWQTDESAIKEARDNLSEKQRQWALDDEVDKLNKLKDKYSEIINLIGSDWDDHQKKLQYTAQIQNMTFDQMSAGLDGFKNNVVANMKQVATATTMTTVISNLTSLIDTLVKLNKVITEIETGSTTDSGLAGLFNRIGKLFGGSSEDGTSNGGFFSKIGSFLSNAWNTVTGKTTTDGAQSSGNLFTNLWNVFTKSTDGAEKKGIFSGFTNAIKNFFFGGGTEGSTGGLVGLIKSGFGTVTSMVTNGVSSLASQSGILGTVGNALMSFGKGIAGVIGGSSGIAGIVSGALSKIPVIGPILLGGTIAVSAIGGGSVTNGLKKIGSGIVDAIKNIGAVIGGAIKSLGTFIFGGTDSSGEKKRGLLGTVFDVVTAPVRWVGSLLGFAKGTTSVSEDGIYNVDEKGEEIIVRAPQQGRATTLSKGDGVIPADITKNLMEIGKNPTGWISKLITKKKTGSSRNENASSGTTKEFLGSITGSPERLKGLVDEIVDVFGFDEIDLTKLKSAKTKGDILSIVKDLANGQMERLRSKFDKVWEKSIEGTGITKAQVDSIGGTIFDRMSAMISNTMDSALNNKDISDNDIKNICADLFQRMGYIYENGWDNLYSLSPDMPEDVSKKLHDSFDIINDKYLSDVDSINEVLGGKIGKVQDSMNVTESSGGSYNGNSMDANIGGEPLLNLSKIKENVKNLFEKFSNSKLGSWLSEHSLGSTIDKLSKYSSSSDPNVLQKALHLFSHPSELAKTVVESTIRAISGTKDTVEWAVKNPDKVAESVEKVAKSAYNSGKKIVNDIEYAVTHPKETFDKIVDNVGKAIDSGINFVKDNLGKLTGKKATGARSINKAGTYNVDERGSELLVRQPQSGRYTYLETGDGVVPADITSRLFEMGGNPDAWFQDQLRKTGLTTNIQSRDTGSSISIGDIYVQQPIGDVDSLARAINNELPNAILQQRRKR